MNHGISRTERRTPSFWAAALGLAFGASCSLVANIPASWLASGLSSATRGRVLLENAQGSVWEGSARAVLADSTGRSLALPGIVKWRARLAWIGADAHAWLECCSDAPLNASVRYEDGLISVRLTGQASRIPASLLIGLGHPWSTLRPQGSLSAQFDGFGTKVNLSGTQTVPIGSARLGLDSFCSTLSLACPMGSYALDFSSEPEPKASARSLPGSALELSIDAALSDSGWRATGYADASESAGNTLDNILPLFGNRQGRRTLIEYPRASNGASMKATP